MAVQGIKNIVDAEIDGKMNTYNFRKNPSQVTTAGLWFDLALSPGNPIPKYWFGTPLAATPISQSADGGFFHGANVSPSKKYLRKLTLIPTSATGLPMKVMICDYLMYYPLVDDGTTDPQVMDNTQTLPRYTDGAGVQVMAVSVAGRTGGQSFYITYTNQDGVSNRTSATVMQNSSAALGVVVTSATATNANTCLFIPLQEGDTGVRSIESVTMLGADVGLFSLVLVKPLATSAILELTAPVEKDFLIESGNLPEIKDDAYLNLVCIPNGSLSGVGILADMKVVWSD